MGSKVFIVPISYKVSFNSYDDILVLVKLIMFVLVPSEPCTNKVLKSTHWVFFLLQIIVIICAYLGPLSAGLSKGILYAGSDIRDIPNWTEHLFLLGGLTSSVFALGLMLRVVGRVRTSATVTILLLILTIVQIFVSGEHNEAQVSGKYLYLKYQISNQ